ncbi:MAG: type II secretion system F family protein [bacterium]|nr:type II secretion system F family protein [bacterium]
MPIYKCKLGDETGKIVEKEIEANDANGLKERLEREGWLLFGLVEKRSLLPSAIRRPGAGRVKISNFIIFNQELVALLKAGLPLLASIETLAGKEENRYFKELLGRVADEVRKGAPLSEALEGAPRVFNKLYISSIKAGEKSGELGTNILRYISYAKRVEELKKKFVSASVYPLILLSVAAIVIMFLILYVVPSFSQVFIDSGTELPVPTRILIGLTDFITSNILIIAILVFISYPSFLVAKKRPEVGSWLDIMKTKIPWIGETLKKYAIAKFCRTLSTLLKSGEPLVTAISLSAGTLDNNYLEENILLASGKVKEGGSLADALEETGLVPSTALKMIMVGESSGALDEMFENVAELFEEEVDRRLNLVTTAIEPVLMLTMGLVIAFIVVAMYLPIFNLAGAVR